MPDRAGPPEFEVTTHRTDGRTVVVVAGELDVAVADELDAAVRRSLDGAPVVLDLSGLSFMDSCGVRLLDGWLRDARARGWTFTVRPDLQAPVRQVLTITGMIGVLPIDEDPEGGA